MKTYLFDFDGTLVDSMPLYVDSMLRILNDHEVCYDKDRVISDITPLGTEKTVEYLIGLGLKLKKEQIFNLFIRYMLEAYFHTIPAKEGVIPTLKQLRETGNSLNILTASPHISLDACLKRLGIFDWFEHVWSSDDFKTTKTDPMLYRTVAERLGERTENILFVDDNFYALETAKKSGMKICGIFDAASFQDTDRIVATADFYLAEFSQLLELSF